jgi:CRP-like cAMP-binding protein
LGVETQPAAFFQIPGELRQALEARGGIRECSAGSQLFERGKPATGVHLLVEGQVILTAPGMPDRVVGPGALLGVPGTLARGVYSLSAKAMQDTKALFVSAAKVMELMSENPQIGFHLLTLLSQEVQALRQQIGVGNKHKTSRKQVD